MTGKRRRATILASAGFLSVVTAVSAAAATLPSSSPSKSQAASATADAVVTVNGAQDYLNFQKARDTAIARADAFQAAEARVDAVAAAKALRAHDIHLRRVRAAQLAAAAAAAQAAAKEAAQDSAQAAQSSSSGSSQGSVTYVSSGTPEQIAQSMLSQYGWSSGEFSCLYPLWERESGWSASAYNASSGAFGIPQALPGSKMASAGSDWQTNAATQIRWGLQYIQSVYGSPCGAWAHEQSSGWY